MSGKMISICGLTCSECPAYIATSDNDSEKKMAVAELWSTGDFRLTLPDVECDGCKNIGERLFKFCLSCEVRQCGVLRNVKNCGHCPDYVCEKLQRLYEQIPEAKKGMEEYRLTQ